MALEQATQIAQREAYHERLRSLHLAEGYSYDENGFKTRPYWPLHPVNQVKAHLWKWEDIRAAVVASGEMVGLGRGDESYDRRVLALTNPGLGGAYSLSGSLFGDIQLIRPGEGAPCHRHTPCAARFIFEGQGWTQVEGERTAMTENDIIFCGQWAWHDHANTGDKDLLFLDVLDIPLTQYFGVSQWEFNYEEITGSAEQQHQPTIATDVDDAIKTQGGIVPRFPMSWKRNPTYLGVHRWSQVSQTLEALRSEPGCPYDGLRVEFANTRTGGSVGPTMSIFTQMLRPGEKTLSHRHTSTTIYVGVKGRGRAHIGDQIFEWGPRDIFVLPSWAWHSHENIGEGDAVLHSISDATLVEKMGLWREQRKTADGQVIDSGWAGFEAGQR